MTKRINITISEAMNEKLDNYGARYGMSKSSIVGFVLGQWADQIDKMENTVYGSTGKEGLIGEILKNLIIENNKEEK